MDHECREPEALPAIRRFEEKLNVDATMAIFIPAGERIDKHAAPADIHRDAQLARLILKPQLHGKSDVNALTESMIHRFH